MFHSLLILPICLVDIKAIPEKAIDSSFILSELSTVNNFVKSYWNEDSNFLLMLFFILSYLVGHFVKVFSIIKYEFLEAVFDNSLNKLVLSLINYFKKGCNWCYEKITAKAFDSTSLYKWLKDVNKPIESIVSKIFVFGADKYYSENESLKTNCVSIINKCLDTNYPDKWYSLYKFSSVITSQENIKSLSTFFLAKYNLYRSLAFIFLFSFFYYNIFFISSSEYLSQDLKKITSLILLTSILFWLTFHYKYKKYWTLCGNETLVSLFYFLNKKKLNEG